MRKHNNLNHNTLKWATVAVRERYTLNQLSRFKNYSFPIIQPHGNHIRRQNAWKPGHYSKDHNNRYFVQKTVLKLEKY